MPKTNEAIFAQMRIKNTLVCCGLDPDPRKFPQEINNVPGSEEYKALCFLRSVVDLTAAHVCAYKPQKAFFDAYAGGHELLREVIAYIHDRSPGVPVIVDCKVGDTDNTMVTYVENIFGKLGADGIIVNPYMGDDVLDALKGYPEKAVVVLVKTSNRNGAIVQDVLLQDGRPFWRHILDLVVDRWNGNQNLIPVLSSTAGLDMSSIRPLMPDFMLVLLAGVGAQGGSFADVRHLLNTDGVGPFINSSRGVLYPPEHPDGWMVAINQGVIELKNLINDARRAL